LIGEGDLDDPLLPFSPVGNSDPAALAISEDSSGSESSVGNLEETGSGSVGNLESVPLAISEDPAPVGNLEPPPLPQASSVGNSDPAALAISGRVGNSEESPLAIPAEDPVPVGNLEDDLDFAPARVGNLEKLEIRSNWRWEFRMRKTVFGIYILERGKDRVPVMYLGPMSPDPKSREYWKQFLPNYEEWSRNGFKRRSKYSRPLSRVSNVMV
jgi:hypothetical protein